MSETTLPSYKYLDDLSIPYQKLSFPTSTEKGAGNVATVLGFFPRQMIKTLIFQTDNGEKVLVMVGGDQNVVSSKLKKAIGSKNIQMASPEVVQEVTGYVIGSIPPFSWQPEGFRSFLDASLLKEKELGVGTGQWGEEIIISPEDLVKASKATVVELTNIEELPESKNEEELTEELLHQYVKNFTSDSSPENLIRISDISNFENKEIRLQGWLANKRSSGSIHFLMIRDGSGFIQAVLGKKDISEEIFNLVDKIGIESSIKVRGNVRKDERAPGGYELTLTDFELVTEAQDYLISKKAHGVDFLLENRHLWLRSKSQFATLRLRSEIIWALAKFFKEEGFIKFDGPMFTANEVEGGSTLFEVDYFGQKAYLTQSAQLYGEAGAMAFGKVYTFGPTFRAEKSKTRRHLTEFWMLEPEVAFYDWKDNALLQERMIHFVIKHCLENCKNELQILGRDISKLEKSLKPFLWIHHKDACHLLQKAGLAIGDREDLGADEEAVLTKMFDQPIVLHHMPAEIKAFYMKPDSEEGDNRVFCNDLLAPEGYGEIIGGSQRIHDLELLEEKLKEEGLNPQTYSWYLDLRRYGSVPHSGFGLGLERLVAWIGGLKHARTAIPFPRMINRLKP